MLEVVLQGSGTDEATSMVARVALIMNSFDRAGKLLHLDQVVDRTGLPRSSAHRILSQLHRAGLLQHRREGYCLTGAPLHGTSDQSRLRGLAAPVLERLHADTSLVVLLGVLAGTDVVYLDKVAGRAGAAVPIRVAGSTPAHASALGKAMLAQLPAEELDARYDSSLRKCTAATIAELPVLHQELARIRSRRGLAFDDQELAVGLSSIAAPIRLSDSEFAGLSLTGAVPVQRLQRMAPFLTRAAAGVSEQVGNADSNAVVSQTTTVTDDMLSRVLRTQSSDDWV